MRLDIFTATIAVVALSSAAHSETFKAGGIEVSAAWSRPAAAGTNGAGFMTLTNKGKAADTLKSVDCPLAARVELHQTSMANGIMSMKKLETGLALAPGQSVALAPGGYHLMLIGLTRATKSGDKIPATLTFASGARTKVVLAVGDAPAGASMHDMPGMKGMDHMNH